MLTHMSAFMVSVTFYGEMQDGKISRCVEMRAMKNGDAILRLRKSLHLLSNREFELN